MKKRGSRHDVAGQVCGIQGTIRHFLAGILQVKAQVLSWGDHAGRTIFGQEQPRHVMMPVHVRVPVHPDRQPAPRRQCWQERGNW